MQSTSGSRSDRRWIEFRVWPDSVTDLLPQDKQTGIKFAGHLSLSNVLSCRYSTYSVTECRAQHFCT